LQINSKVALDKVIRKSRVHLYKPIQIAEILYHHRTSNNFEIEDLESYRNLSKKWRDQITKNLIGRVSTSSQKFQDNIFEANALPPKLIKELADLNEKSNGLIENYIYHQLEDRMSMVKEADQYILSSTPNKFKLDEFISLFIHKPGLKRSIDKAYEIIVYALFSTLVRELGVEITLSISNQDNEIMEDFDKFINLVLGLSKKKNKISLPANLFRVGVTNAADRGLDMWTNFGPAIQVKHLTLSEELAEDVTENISADKIVLICLDGEAELIEKISSQLPLSSKIQGIITLSDLEKWYSLCLSKKYQNNLGRNLLQDLRREFISEFPSTDTLSPFLKERKYERKHLVGEWVLKTD